MCLYAFNELNPSMEIVVRTMDKLSVVSVEPPNSEDASVTLGSEKAELVAFCWPCELEVGDLVDNQLTVLDDQLRTTARRQL